MGRALNAAALAQSLGKERFFPLCAPTLFAAGSLAAKELLQQRLIHSVKSQMQWPRWFVEAGVEPAKRWKRVLFDRSHMAIDAAVDGMGIVLESELLAWRELRDGRLVCPVKKPPEVALTTQWIVCPHGHLRHRKTRTFLDWLRKERDSWRERLKADSLARLNLRRR